MASLSGSVLSIVGLPKVALVPWEGPNKGKPIFTQYNPESLSFSKSVNWGENKSSDKDTADPIFTGSDGITLQMEFFYDLYESKGDVRPLVHQIIALTECQEFEPEKADETTEEDASSVVRPPRVQFIWRDANPLGTGKAYFAVLKSVDVSYTMFLDDGTPCRASVKVSCQQVASMGDMDNVAKASEVVVSTAGLTAAAIENMGGRSSLEASGGKIEDPSTWPPVITIKSKL